MAFKLDESSCRNLEVSLRREWLLANGIGGFAMGTASGINTRRYHGHLVAATDPPATRMVLLAAIDAFIQTDGNPEGISANQYPGTIFPQGYLLCTQFSAGEAATWTFKSSEFEVDKVLRIHPGKNAVTIEYVNKSSHEIRLTLRPLCCHKFYHANFSESGGYPQTITFPKDQTNLTNDGVTLYLSHPKAERVPVQGWYYRFEHFRETERGLDPRDDLYCPCELTFTLGPGERAVLVASTEDKVKPLAASKPEDAEDYRLQPQLQAAAEKFLVRTENRTSIIAGYPWFTDWGRDTMISLPGVMLHTGKVAEARQILSDYASQSYQGLIPNRFVEKGDRPDFNTVDATLWFANAIYKTLLAEWNQEFAADMHAKLKEVYEWHVRGTLFGIKVDAADGLLTQGEGGVQLTWMDAKIGDWVVTPRYGKPVEINGLWINLLRILEWISDKLGDQSKEYADAAKQAEASFEKKFWKETLGFYLDTVDPDDASLRPNQVIAMALPFGPARGTNAERALQVVSRELLTPVGLRTLGPHEAGYRGRYQGPLNEMDASYHQGTAWPWLLGPYVTALVKLTGDKAEGKRILKNAKSMLQHSGLGGVAEVYDGDNPQYPNGCPYQAWSAAELLRAFVEDCGGD